VVKRVQKSRSPRVRSPHIRKNSLQEPFHSKSVHLWPRESESTEARESVPLIFVKTAYKSLSIQNLCICGKTNLLQSINPKLISADIKNRKGIQSTLNPSILFHAINKSRYLVEYHNQQKLLPFYCSFW